MNTAIELEQWLRKEATLLRDQAASRRIYAHCGDNLTDTDRKLAHSLSEEMAGRKLPYQSRKQEAENAKMQDQIASKLDKEAARLLRFADYVSQNVATQVA